MKMTDRKTNNTAISPPTVDPIHDLINSERYIESLEKKLNRVKGKSKEPTSKEIIHSLEKTRDAQMQHLLNSCNLSDTINTNQKDYDGSVLNKSHTGKQQTVEEVVAIVFHDELSKVSETESESENKK